MQVFVADSLTKVMRESSDDERPLQGGPARISACRNERESFQVVVAAGVRPRRGVSVRVSDLTREGGPEVIPSDRCLVNPVGYVETRRPAYEVDRVGWWPDPLLPNAPMEIEAGRRQPFWITVHVPETAAPGRYSGTITVSADSLADRTVPFELTVWDFALAPAPPLPSGIAIYPGPLEQFYNTQQVPQSTLRNYWDMLFSHRLSSDDLGTPLRHGIQAVMEGRETAPFDYDAFDEKLEYCLSRGLTAFMVARLPGFQDQGPDLTREQQDRIVAYLRDFANHLEERGWLDRGFVFVWDEPREARSAEVLKELQTAHLAHPRLRSRLDGPVTGPLVQACEAEVDIWGLHMLNIAGGGVQAEANLDRWRRENRVLWMYVACDVHHPYPNIFIDYSLIDCRILPWLYWKYDIEGFLYWSANWWGEENMAGARPENKWPNRPWVSANFVSDWSGGRQEHNGDGHLIYPGPDGTALSSVRLEALRDGMEDYEYLWLLAGGLRALEAEGREPELVLAAQQWLDGQHIVGSFTNWCRDPDELLTAREQLADLIVRVLRAAEPPQ